MIPQEQRGHSHALCSSATVIGEGRGVWQLRVCTCTLSEDHHAIGNAEHYSLYRQLS
jgi:hypothetical protein